MKARLFPVYCTNTLKTYIISHQLHDSLFCCNFVEYLSSARVMTDKFTNIMTSHAKSLNTVYLNKLMGFVIPVVEKWTSERSLPHYRVLFPRYELYF